MLEITVRSRRSIPRVRLLLAFLVGILPALAMAGGAGSQDGPGYWIELERVAGGFEEPLWVVDPGDGSGRLFVVEKRGVIRVLQDGAVLDAPFLDIRDRVLDENYEEGMLALAFHPDFASNGAFYVTYTTNSSDWQLDRYHVSPDDPNRADPESAETLLTIEHRGIEHYGGMLAFGPDGNLCVSVGDGGGKFDPYGNGQNPHTLLGTILRITPSTGSEPGSEPYTIPPDNPFASGVEGRPEVWAYGLRNPWRFSFDRETGDLYIADVGQGTWEEVNYVPAGPQGYPVGGWNFGWPEMEGGQCSEVAPECDPSLYTLPVVQYNHHYGCSVTGGYVERADPASPLYGRYVFADFCSGDIWVMERSGDEWHAEVRLDTDYSFSSFGEDAVGNIYATDIDGGDVYRITATEDTPRPVITSVWPAWVPAGGAACRIDLHGWNFTPDASVSVGGLERPVDYVDETRLIVTLDAADLAAAGEMPVTVANADLSDTYRIDIAPGRINGRAVYERWARTDLPVMAGDAGRTWMWGPQGLTCTFLEPYLDSPGGLRAVQYFDKSRMEVNDPGGDTLSAWYVTNGLLVAEMVTGQVQVGHAIFEPREPAAINVAGDVTVPDAPTYQSFTALLDAPAAVVGEVVTRRIDRSGEVTPDPALAAHGVTVAAVAPETGHGIAAPFWEFMQSSGPVHEDGAIVEGPLFANPFYATGLPITEPYWTRVRVDGAPRDVLVQLFERRVLTYTPDNPEGWRVESGNAGRHYYQWRYGQLPFEDAGRS